MVTNNPPKSNLVYYLIVLAMLSLAFFFFLKYQGVSGEARDASYKGVTRAEVESIVKETLNSNPKLVVDSLQKWSIAQEKAAFDEVQKRLDQFKDKLENNTNDPRVGNPKGLVKLVSFYDYSCGYCRRMLPVEEKLLSNHAELQIIYKPFPILGESSVLATRAILAANLLDPSKVSKMHTELFNQKGERNMESVIAIASSLGYDAAAFSAKMADKAVEQIIQETVELAGSIGIRSTPTLVINGKLIPGAVNFEDINLLVTEALQKASTTDAAAAPTSSGESK
jgi:protein-disulfide isomerase